MDGGECMICVKCKIKEIKDNFICFWFKFSFWVKLKFHFSFLRRMNLQSKGMQLSDNKEKILLFHLQFIFIIILFQTSFKTSSFRQILISYYYIFFSVSVVLTQRTNQPLKTTQNPNTKKKPKKGLETRWGSICGKI